METKKVVIIDYQLSNLFSVYHACKQIGLDPVITSDKKEILQAEFLILPGVGAFGDAMNNLHKLDLVSPIHEYVATGKPFMGVCLGLQLLFTESEEFGNHKGLNLVEGIVKKFPSHLKVPQIGWNKIQKASQTWENTPLHSQNEGNFMYFVHSFYVEPINQADILTETNYCGVNYCSSVKKNNIFATQFHPEKSAKKGLEIYKNWAE